MDATGIISDGQWADTGDAGADAPAYDHGTHDYVASWPQPADSPPPPAALGTIAMKWAALHQAGQVVAAIAGADDDNPSLEARAFPAIMREAGGWRCRLAEQGIDDLTAIMEPGLCALLSALDRGADPRAAARSLWDEFVAARDAMVALAPPDALNLAIPPAQQST
ncbi:hypothetical protein WBP06_16190 [Novosphingobium sp. BL-8H]|uniref:hypothetical protein n=1 Tax=Novosphingobium sp. BL-8H TaxID=3127640 RepID=UPI0037574D62